MHGFEANPEPTPSSAGPGGLGRTWRRLTVAHPAITDAGARRRAEFLSGLLTLAIPLGSAAAWLRAWADPAFLEGSIAAQLGVVALLLIYVVSRSRFAVLAAWLCCVAAQVIALAISLFHRELWVLFGYVSAPILLAGIVLPVRATVIFSATAAVALVARALVAPTPDVDVFLSAALPFLFGVTALVALGTRIRDGLERDRRAELQESEARYRRLFDASFGGYAIVEEGAVVEVAGDAAELLGRSADALLGEPIADVLHRDEASLERLVVDGGTTELSFERADGERAELEMVGSEVPYQGRSARLFALRDMSDRRRMDAILQSSERALALGQVAAGVAHEINNPLSFITANVEALEQRNLTSPELAGVAEELAEIREGAERIRVIVNDMRALSTPAHDLEPVDVRGVVDLALRMTKGELASRAQVEVHGEEQAFVLGSKAKLGQVFVNLLVNAARALPEGQPGEQRVRVFLAKADQSVRIEVADTGQGIPADVLPRVFDPFFTTRKTGSGMGLGLAICHTIVRAHGGEITVESGRKGTVFTVTLPLTSERPAPKVVSTKRTPEMRVLVIDDEAALCRAISKMLKGHEVMIAHGAAEGLQLARVSDPDVILCDLVMPDGGGAAVVDGLARDGEGRDRRVVLMTGGAFTPADREFLDRFAGQVLAKPMRAADVRGACATIMTARVAERAGAS